MSYYTRKHSLSSSCENSYDDDVHFYDNIVINEDAQDERENVGSTARAEHPPAMQIASKCDSDGVETELRELEDDSSDGEHDYEEESESEDDGAIIARPASIEPTRDFFAPSFGNVRIDCDDGKVLFAHREVLGLWTSYFGDQMIGGIRVRAPPSVTGEQMELYLSKVYPPCDLTINEANIEALVHVAFLTQTSKLMEQCLRTLEAMSPSLLVARLADRYPSLSPQLLTQMIVWMSDNFGQVRDTASFKAMSKETILSVMEKNAEKPPPTKRFLSILPFPWS